MTQHESKQWILPERAFGECFGCAPHNTKGLKLRFWYTEEGCISYHRIPQEYCGFTGLIHGGIIATLLDEVAAWTVITHLFRVGMTIQVLVKYLKPVPTDEDLVITGKIKDHIGDRVTVLSEIKSEEGVILAEAESKWLLPNNTLLEKITGLNGEKINLLASETIEYIKKKQEE